MPGGFGGLLHSGGWQLKRITFVPSKCPDAHSTNPAELGLIPLNDPVEPDGDNMRRPAGHAPKNRLHSAELFSEKDVVLHWLTVRKTGAGLQNLGNTCFMNSVLQCLTHTPPLAELFLSSRSLAPGSANGFDPLGITRELVQRSLRHRGPIVSPVAHAKSLRRICRSFRLGRQEDAHEYLVALLDAMHERSIMGLNPKPAPELAQTSFIYRIFAGKIRSQVKCAQCGFESNTYDPFLDLSLEITRANTVERALERFTAGEVLDGGNKYKCSKEQKLVRAVKRMTIHAAPNVLVVQLKRFEFSMSGHKISKKVDFGATLDLSPYMSRRPAVPALYDLYGVLVHSGHSVHSGHYYCFVRSGTGMWHICDDTNVSQVSERMVLGQKAYILFYTKRTPSAHNAPPSPAAAEKAAALASPAASPATKNLFQQRQDAAQQQPSRAPSPPAAAVAAAAALSPRSAAAQAAAAVPMAAGNQPMQERRQPPSQQQQQHKRSKVAADAKRMQPAPSGSAGEEAATPAKRPKAVAAAAVQERQQEAGGGAEAEAPLAAAAGPAEARPPSPPGQRLLLPALTRQRQRARLAGPALLTPSKGTLSRREQRLAEVSKMHRTLGKARQQRRRTELMQAQQEQEQQQQQPPAGSPLPATARKGAPGKAAPAAAAADAAVVANGAASSPSSSTVTAPDWPPVKAPAVQRQQAQQGAAEPEAAPTTGVWQPIGQRRAQQQQPSASPGPAAKPAVARGAEAKKFLQQATGGRMGLAAGQWDTVDVETKRQHDRMLQQAAPKRKQPDEYDEEYDRGKLKKVRSKASAEGGEAPQLDSRAFDAAWQDKQRGGGPSGSNNLVQLRGNKLKRHQQHQQQQRRRPRRDD